MLSTPTVRFSSSSMPTQRSRHILCLASLLWSTLAIRLAVLLFLPMKRPIRSTVPSSASLNLASDSSPSMPRCSFARVRASSPIVALMHVLSWLKIASSLSDYNDRGCHSVISRRPGSSHHHGDSIAGHSISGWWQCSHAGRSGTLGSAVPGATDLVQRSTVGAHTPWPCGRWPSCRRPCHLARLGTAD